MSPYSEKIQQIYGEVGKVIIGQEELKRDILVALFSGGHVLIEGAPGLAKTRTVRAFSEAIKLSFQRIQFTPDLLPSDLTGARIYDPDAKIFDVKKGPVFANFVLADEINRAPSKVQSALLEAMEEHQVTIGNESFSLPEPFMVLATQNPIEQEGTFSLPEAQLDRFLMKILVHYPSKGEQKNILVSAINSEHTKISKVLTPKDILTIRKEIEEIEISESILEYICDITEMTRDREKFPEIIYGVSPRAALSLLKCSKALAYIEGRNFVIPEDVKALTVSVLRHRIILSYEALAEGIAPDTIIKNILSVTKIR